MSEDLARYDVLLSALYDPDVPAPVIADRVARFEVERTRRILDVARIMTSSWPRTVAVARAWSGDATVHGTAAAIPGLRGRVPGFAEAVEEAFRAWVDAHEAAVLPWLLRFEQARRGRQTATRPATADEEAQVPDGLATLRVLRAPFDIARTVRTIDFLTERGATAAMLRKVTPVGAATSVGFYSRAGKVYAVPLD